MRPKLIAVVVVLVLLSAAFVSIASTMDRSPSTPGAVSSGLRTAVAPNYEIAAAVTTEPVLPGYHDSIWYDVLNDTYLAPVQTLSTITITGTYYNTALKLLKMPGTPVNVSTAPVNTWSFLVPVNASTDAFDPPVFTIYANSSSLHMNQSATVDVRVGTLDIGGSVCPMVGACGTLVVGEPATVNVFAEAVNEFHAANPQSNESVKILFFSTGSSPVTVPGVPATLRTNGQGEASVTFTPSSSIFNVPGPNHVELEVTDAVNGSLTKYLNVSWDLVNPVGTLNYEFYLNSATYYSGQTVTAYWEYDATNTTVGVVNVTNYIVIDEDTDNLIANGLVGSTATSGSFSFALPAGYAGEFVVEALAHNSTEFWAFEQDALAYQPTLAVNPSELFYQPGDTITVTVVWEGPALTGATIAAIVQGPTSDQTLFNGNVTGTSFQFTIPKVSPADEYEIVAWVSTPSQGTVAVAYEYVDEASGYNFLVGVTTVSPYSDGSFAPGQTIQVSYKLVAYGNDPLPTEMSLYLCNVGCEYDTPYLMSWVAAGSSGSFSFTIPAGTPNGPQIFEVETYFTEGVESEGYGEGIFTVVVNSSPSPLNYELVGDSGLTVGWLILLLLIIIVAIVVVMSMRRRGSKPTMVMSPAPASSSAPEWKEPSSGNPPASGGSDSSTTPPGAQ